MRRCCPRCKADLPIEAFGISRRRKDGVSCWCKACNRTASQDARSTEEGARKHRERERQRGRDNAESAKGRAKAWYHANKLRAAAAGSRAAKRRMQCPVYRLWENERQRKWYRQNPANGVAKTRKRQLAKNRAMPSWLTPTQLAQIQAFYEIAAALKTQTGIKHNVDHIIPLQGDAVSGLHVPWNLQVIPASLNSAKSNKILEEFG